MAKSLKQRRKGTRSRAQSKNSCFLGQTEKIPQKKKNQKPLTTRKLQRKITNLKAQAFAAADLLKDQVKKTNDVMRDHKNTRRKMVRLQNSASIKEDKLRKMEGINASLGSSVENSLQVENRPHTPKSDVSRLKKQNKALKMKVNRSRTAKTRAVDKAMYKASKEVQKKECYHLKECGTVTDSSRALIRGLIEIGLPTNHVTQAIQTVAKHLGVKIEGNVTSRSVRRVVLEGGIASKMQVAEEIEHTQNITLSSDGTTLRNLNYESKHVNLKTTLYEAENLENHIVPGERDTLPGQRITRYLGLVSSKDHTSATQLQGWKDTIQDMNAVYNESPRGIANSINPISAPAKITGFSSDHAADQKKLAGFLEEWMIESDRIARGETAIKTWSPEDLLPLLIEESQKKIDAVGGIDMFEALSDEEQEQHNIATFKSVCFVIGTASFDAMSKEERDGANLFIWAGCCMHKELNAVKGGDGRMKQFWINHKLTPPIQLMNKDNEATAEAGPSDARDRAIAVSTGGATKLTALAGAIFNHKDQKKGQADSFKIFFERELGYTLSFPDTSNTRYQSHCEAAAALLIHLPLYIKFLQQVRDKKEKRRFNHMEQNVFRGLQDNSSLTELAVLTLYGQAISHPYLREIRGPCREHTNVLDTGPLHERVKDHCRALIASPSLLLAPGMSYKTGSMDGKNWNQPEAIYAVQALSSTLPHLEGALVAFFEGALETWERFTSEFEPGGKIATSSALERERSFIKTTNDDNEGALGMLRVGSRHAPNMTLHQRNARAMYKKNTTSLYIEGILTKADLKFLRKKARQVDGSGVERQRRQAQAENDKHVVEVKRAKDTERAAKKQKADATLDSVECRFSVEGIRNDPGTNAQLDLELGWFRRIDTEVPMKARLGTKAVKIEALCAAVDRYNLGATHCGDNSGAMSEIYDSDSDSDADMELGY